MTAKTWVNLECDGKQLGFSCNETFVGSHAFATSHESARFRAANLGWTYPIDPLFGSRVHIDLCPQCSVRFNAGESKIVKSAVGDDAKPKSPT